MKREAEAKRAKIILALGLLFMIAGSFLSSFLTKTIGNLSTREIRFENPSGNLITAVMYKSGSVADGEKRPAVIMVAGEFENKEKLDFAAMELAKKGLIVMAIDNQGHGETEINSDTPEYLSINDAAQYLSGISYIDSTRIGVVGFTKYAGDMINKAILDDNNGSDRLFSSVLYVGADPIFMRGSAYANLYEGRHVGVISAKYDDLSHHRDIRTSDGKPEAFAPTFAESFDAISFLNFGRDPSRLPAQSADAINTIHRYGNRDNGAIRVIYVERASRADIYYSPLVIRDACNFFAEAYGTQAGTVTGQLWLYSLVFGLLSIVGLMLFVMSISVLMSRTQFFADVSILNDTDEDYMVFPMRIKNYDYKGLIWFWAAAFVSVVFMICTYMRLAGFGYSAFREAISQRETFAISSWLFVCGIFLLVVFYLWYRFYASSNEYNLVRMGVAIPKVVLGKTILLALFVSFISYMMIFICKYFFSSDMMFYGVSFNTFTVKRLVMSVWPYMPLMIVFFIGLSIFQNTVLYCNILGKLNGFFTALMASVPALFFPVLQYVVFVSRNKPLFYNSLVPYNEFVIWLMPLVLIMFGVTLASRYVFTRTKNSYLPGIVNAIIVTLMIASNTKMF